MAGVQPTPPGGNKKPGNPMQRQASLPHQQKVQPSFGQHNVGNVRVSNNPANANAAMGAQAFAQGNKPAFGRQPSSKNLPAHEAAHVVQQRGPGKPKP